MTTTESPARTVRKSTITLGLVSVPVKLFTTGDSAEEVKFNMLHDTDNAKLKQQYVCTGCTEVVDKEHTVKGFEHAPGQFVVFTDDELEALKTIGDGSLVIHEFITPGALDPIYCSEGKSYYLGPDKGSEHGYVLLLEALQEGKRIAIATCERDGKLLAIRAAGRVLVIHELRHAAEVRSADGVPVVDVTTNPALLREAKKLVERMSSPTFVPERYVDNVAAKRRAMIQQKIDGNEIVVPKAETPAAPIDLLDALRASLDKYPVPATPAPARGRKERARSVAAKGAQHKKAATAKSRKKAG